MLVRSLSSLPRAGKQRASGGRVLKIRDTDVLAQPYLPDLHIKIGVYLIILYYIILIYCHVLKHMKHFLLKSCARRRASI